MNDYLDLELLALQAREILGVCAVIGPKPGPGMLPYLCTLPIGHSAAHVAKDLQNGTVYDSWMD